MTRSGTPPIESISAEPAAGVVLRGVTMSRDARALGRPRAAAPLATLARPPERAGERPVARTPASIATSPAQRLPADATGGEQPYQEHGRGFQAGYEEGRKKGHAEGFEEGRAQGHEAGLQAGTEQGREAALRKAEQADAAARQGLHERTAQLDALLSSLPDQFEQRLTAAEEDMLGLCFEAVARVLGEAAASEPGMRALLRRALAEAAGNEALEVHVSPHDLALLQSDAEAAARLAGNRRVQWVGDERVQSGGCLVTSAHGSLDARLETQLVRLSTLFKSVRNEAGAA